MGVSLRLLIVESSEDDAQFILLALKQGGFEPVSTRVETYESMSEALEKEAWDIVLCDYTMPQFNAFAALELLQSNGLDLPLIIVSGTIGEDVAVRAMRAGANDYIMKDNLTRLVPAVGRELREADVRRQCKRAEEEIKRCYQVQTALNEILHISLEDIPLDEMLDKILDNLSLPWSDFELQGAIFLVENEAHLADDPGVLVMKASRGLHKLMETECSRVPSGKCIYGCQTSFVRAATSGRIEFVSSVDENHEVRFEGVSAHGQYCAPIRFGGKVLGVLNIYLKEGHPRDEKEEEVLRTIADVLAGIIVRKRVEEERSRLAAEIGQIEEAIVITDTDATIQYANPAFERITGYSREKTVGQNPSIFESDNHGEALYKETWNTLACGETWKGQCINKKRDGRDGTLYKENAVISPVRDTSDKTINYVDVKRDVTREVALQEQLSNAEKLVTTGKIAASIAHEIKNPIFAISSGIQILQDHLKLNDGVQGTLDIIFRQTMRVDRLIKQLLKYSTPQEINPTPNQIKKIISEVILLNQGLLRSMKIEIREKIPENMPPIYVDKDRITQVLINLLQNAIDVSKEGDCIEIACHIDMKNQRAVIKVKDEGPGISEDLKLKIFGLFFTTKKEGSGMGLAISKRIVMDHGGDIRVESRKKRGTAMVVELPLGKDNA